MLGRPALSCFPKNVPPSINYMHQTLCFRLGFRFPNHSRQHITSGGAVVVGGLLNTLLGLTPKVLIQYIR